MRPLVYSIKASEREIKLNPLFIVSLADRQEWQELRRAKAPHVMVGWDPGPGDYAKKINYGIEVTDDDWILAGADDLNFHSGWAEEAVRVSEQTRKRFVGTNDRANPAVMSGKHATHPLVHRSYVTELGTIDEPGKLYHEGYSHQCNPPESPIWMADLSFKPIGEVQVGDRVIGWMRPMLNPSSPEMIEAILHSKGSSREVANRFGVSSTHVQAIRSGKHPSASGADNAGRPWQRSLRMLCSTEVLAVHQRTAQLVRVELESGRKLRCTPDHLWLNPNWSPSQWSREWIEAKRGASLLHVIDPPPPLTPSQERLGGWLGGIFDGEGSWHPSPQIGQSKKANPEVYDAIEKVLDIFKFDYTSKNDRFWLNGGWRELVRFLHIAQPVKHREKLIEYVSHARRFGRRDKIISVTPDRFGEVVSLTTETGNYVAWGYASKNCVDNEACGTAKYRNEFVFAQMSVVEHLHPIYPRPGERRVEMDDTYRKGMADGKADMALLRARQHLWGVGRRRRG